MTVAWTIAGMGPDEDELKRRWAFNPSVRWLGTLANAALLGISTRAGSVRPADAVRGLSGRAWSKRWRPACVPIVSDIPSGVPEIVDADVNGERPPVGDVARLCRRDRAARSRPRDASKR